jgi:hypothetical protein
MSWIESVEPSLFATYFFVRDVNAATLVGHRESLRTRTGGEFANHIGPRDIADVDHVLVSTATYSIAWSELKCMSRRRREVLSSLTTL